MTSIAKLGKFLNRNKKEKEKIIIVDNIAFKVFII